MSVIIKTNDPEKIMSAIQDGIKSNKINSWKVNEMGKIVHTPNQYCNKGWFNPQIDSANKQITFNFENPEQTEVNKSLYGSYHGRLINMLFSNFFQGFDITSVCVQ